MNYEAIIICYNNAIARFEFHADSAALANDHVKQLVEDDNMKCSFEWNMFPGQIHYIRYKKKDNLNYKYCYTIKDFERPQPELPCFSEVYKKWNEYDELKEERDLLIEALKNILSEFEDKSVQMKTPIAYFRHFNKAEELLNNIKK